MPADQAPVKKSASEQKFELEIYEPAMCCSTGVCGPKVDPRLAVFAGALKQTVAQGFAVERFNLGQEPPRRSWKTPRSRRIWHTKIPKNCPSFTSTANGSFFRRYPEAAELFASLGLQPGETPPDVAPQSAMPMAAHGRRGHGRLLPAGGCGCKKRAAPSASGRPFLQPFALQPDQLSMGSMPFFFITLRPFSEKVKSISFFAAPTG